MLSILIISTIYLSQLNHERCFEDLDITMSNRNIEYTSWDMVASKFDFYQVGSRDGSSVLHSVKTFPFVLEFYWYSLGIGVFQEYCWGAVSSSCMNNEKFRNSKDFS